VNLYAPVAGQRIGSLLVRQKENQVRLAFYGHDFFRSRTKSALRNVRNGSTAAVARWATRTASRSEAATEADQIMSVISTEVEKSLASFFEARLAQMISRDSSTPLGMT
jgi:hypothetical protein